MTLHQSHRGGRSGWLGDLLVAITLVESYKKLSRHYLNMESLAASSQDNLIHSLDFSLSPDSASYVENRSESCFYASSNSFSPNGVKAIRIAVAASTFVDLGSAYLTFRLHNDGTDPFIARDHGSTLSVQSLHRDGLW
jgi:hypothetical protein